MDAINQLQRRSIHYAVLSHSKPNQKHWKIRNRRAIQFYIIANTHLTYIS